MPVTRSSRSPDPPNFAQLANQMVTNRRKNPQIEKAKREALAQRFVDLCVKAGLIPSREYPFAKPARDWRFDFAFMATTDTGFQQVAVECEGGAYSGGRHVRGKGFIEDMLKYNTAQLRGWIVLRYTPQQLCLPSTIEQIKEALAR